MKIEAAFAGTSTCQQHVTLYASVEMGSTGWLVTSRASHQDRVQRRRVATNDWQALIALLRRQQKAQQADRIVCGYEAGREGFWPYRALKEAGIEACVLDPASLAVDQRGRRTKTDRTDGLIEVDGIEALDLGRRTAARPVVVPTANVMATIWKGGAGPADTESAASAPKGRWRRSPRPWRGDGRCRLSSSPPHKECGRNCRADAWVAFRGYDTAASEPACSFGRPIR